MRGARFPSIIAGWERSVGSAEDHAVDGGDWHPVPLRIGKTKSSGRFGEGGRGCDGVFWDRRC